jgi:hypothetical protein
VHDGDVAGCTLQRRSQATVERCDRLPSDFGRDLERLERDAVVFASHLEQRAITVDASAPQDVRRALSNLAVRLFRSQQKRVAVPVWQIAQSRRVPEE